ncbi:MAG: hypothetical protein ACXAB8_15720 [Promethearchaeota archaeon]
MKNVEQDSLNLGNETSKTKIEGDLEYNSAWLEKRSFRLALISTFSALSIVLGYTLAYIPNIELLTCMIFLSGFILGKRDGLIVGLLSSAIFVFFNPVGASPPPLLAYQLIHYSLLGLTGGLTRSFLKKKTFYKPKEDLYVFWVMLLFGILGGVITFIYDILSTLVGGFIVSLKFEYFLVTYLSGMIFTSVHLIGNVLIFIFILPGMIQLIYKMLY